MVREIFDYEVIKPDQSEIMISRVFREYVGKFVWDERTHKYEFKGIVPVSDEELEELLKAIKKLNNRSILPKWLKWSKN